MLGRILDRRWIVLLVSVSLIGTSKWCEAKQMPDPDLLMSEAGLMLVVVDDLPSTIVQGKKFFDGVYKEYREQGVLGPLDSPSTQFFFQGHRGQRNDESFLPDISTERRPKHWMIKAVDSIATNGTDLERIWRPIADQLAEDSTQVTAADEDNAIRAFARLFAGKLFLGVEDYNPHRTTVFGFEYDSAVFDWLHEFRLVAEHQREQYGYEDESTTISGVEVIHLPNEGWYVFSVDNVIYGVIVPQIDKVRLYLERVLHLNENHKPTWKSLRGDRRFRRALVSELGSTIHGHGVFLYLNFREMFSRTSKQSSRLPSQKFHSQVLDSKIKKCFDDFACYACSFRFDDNVNALHYKIVYPLYSPTSKPLNQFLIEYDDVAIPKSLPLPANSQQVSLVRIRVPKPGFSMSKSPCRIFHMSIPTLNFYPEKSYLWDKDKADIFNILDGVSADSNYGFEINYFAYFARDSETLRRLQGSRHMPGAMVSAASGTSAELLLSRMNTYCEEHNISIASVLSNSRSLSVSSSMAEWGRESIRWSPYPEQHLLDEPASDEVLDSANEESSFQVLARRQVGNCEVLFIGVSKIEFLLVDSDEYIFVLPCLSKSEYAVAQMIEEIAASNVASVPVPREFLQHFSEGYMTKQFLYQTKFNQTVRGIDRWFACAADSLVDGANLVNMIDYELNETFSLAYIVHRILLNALGGTDEFVAEQIIPLMRSRDPVDWFRAICFQNGNAIQIGSMMLRD